MKEFVEKLIGRLQEIPTKNKCSECPHKKKCDEVEAMDKDEQIDLCGATIKALAIDTVEELAEEYINCSTDTSTTKADRIRSMSDEELAEFFYNTYHYFENGENIVRFNRTEIHDNETDILEWLQSEVEGGTDD